MNYFDSLPTSIFEYLEQNKPIVSENDTLNVVIKPEALDLSNVKDYNGKESYRPKKLDEYIGQQKAKDRVLCYIDGCKKYNEHFPNTFISAPSGCGKTVFSNIIADLLGKKFVVTTAGEIKSEQQLVDKIVECESGVLLLDEIHRLSNKIGTFMLPILEEYMINGKKIKPFTLIGATTHKGNLAENLSALLQRFPLNIELENYTINNLVTIFKQFLSKQYPQEKIEEKILLEIANNSRFTPRIGLTLLREYIYVKNIEKVKKNNNIFKEGLTDKDIKALLFLNLHNGAGKGALSKFLRVEPKTYEFSIEPFLIEKELITIGNKRIITEKGKQLLEAIK